MKIVKGVENKCTVESKLDVSAVPTMATSIEWPNIFIPVGRFAFILTSNNGHLFTKAGKLCPQGSHCREVQLYLHIHVLYFTLTTKNINRWSLCGRRKSRNTDV